MSREDPDQIPPAERKPIKELSTNERLLFFLEQHFVLSVTIQVPAPEGRTRPYSFSCFFAWDEGRYSFIFLSSEDSYHGKILTRDRDGKRHYASGTIHTCHDRIAEIQGIQATGWIFRPHPDHKKELASHYIQKYPESVHYPGELYLFTLDFIKFTDNPAGFGSKSIYGSPPQTHDFIY